MKDGRAMRASASRSKAARREGSISMGGDACCDVDVSMTAILYELCHLQASSINFDVP